MVVENLNTQEVGEVKQEVIMALRDRLRASHNLWIRDLADLMYPQSTTQKKKDPMNKKARNRIYNIVSNQIKNPDAKVQFLIKGGELLEKYQADKDRASQITESFQLNAAS